MAMRKRRKKNPLPDAKDQRIAELEQQLAQYLSSNIRRMFG